MKIKIKFLLLSLITIIAISGCSTKKMAIATTKPSQVAQIKAGTKIAVAPFDNDFGNRLSTMVQSKLTNKKIQGSNYLEVISQEDTLDIQEQEKITSNNINDQEKTIKFAKALEAAYLVTGSIDGYSSDSDYIRSYTRCVSWYPSSGLCQRYERYKDLCSVVQADIQATINLIDAESGKIIYSKPYTKGWDEDTCEYYSLSNRPNLRNALQAEEYLLEEISTDFVNSITPTIHYTKIEIMQDADYNLDKMQKQQWVKALKYIEQNRLEKAKNIYKDLNKELNQKSYAVAYNYALMLESQGEVEKAYDQYMLADSLVEEPNRLISDSIIRIKISIEDKKTLNKQLKK